MALERISNLGQLQEMQAEKLKKKLSSSTLSQQHANGFDDDLKLRTTTQLMIENNATQNLKDSPEKKYLQKEVERLQLQVSQMNSAVRQRDDELDKLKQTLDDERSIMAKNGISGSATQKIIELSHRNRDLHAELNKERSKSRQLQEKMSKLQQMIKDSEEENMKVADPSVEVKQKELISQLESQLCQVKQKAAEYSNNCQVIKQDLKIAHKILAREIGEKSVNVSNLIANGGEGWKGRAQQILALQEKVAELKRQQLKSTDKSFTPQKSSRKPLEDKHKVVVHKMEAENKKKFQELKVDLEQVQNERDKLKGQCSALKARNKTLTSETKELKAHLIKINEQMKEKDRVLLNEITSKCRGNSEKIDKSEDYEKEIKCLRSQLSHSNGERVRLEKIVSDMQEKQIQNASSDSLDQNKTEYTAASEPLKLPPINKTHLLQNATKNKKIVRSSMSAENMHERRHDRDFEEIVSLCRTTEIERNKLLELCQVLQERLDIMHSELTVCKCQLLQHKNKQPMKCIKGSDESITDLCEKLSLKEDENTVLKETLELTRQQKIEDMKLFRTILNEIRNNKTIIK